MTERDAPLAPARGIVTAVFLAGLFWSGVVIGIVLHIAYTKGTLWLP